MFGDNGHRFSKQVLFADKTAGGLGLPHLAQYYKAAQVAQLSTVYAYMEKPDWIAIERMAINCFPMDYIKWQSAKHRASILAPILSNSLAICDRVQTNHKLVSPFFH